MSRLGAAVLALSAIALACAPAAVAPVTSASVASSPPATALPAASTPEPAPTTSPAPATPFAFPSCDATAKPDEAARAVCLPHARVDIDVAISDADAAAIVTQVQADLDAVQSEFEWTIRGTARIDVYATRERYVFGLQTVFGYPKATAEFVADNSVAFFEPSLTRIAVSWAEVQGRRPIAAMRHELTHVVTLEACAPRCDLVPAWLNEGQAHLAEAQIPGADWRMLRIQYEAASMVATRSVIPLTSLWTQAQWNAYSDWDGYYKYQEAARAVELLRADIGDRAIARLYARIRAGSDVATAYAALSGKTFASYLAALSSRLADVPAGPAIVTIVPGADGHGASFLLYGFPAEATITLRLSARHIDETQEIMVSPQGAYFGSIDDTYPPGAYTISASGPASASAQVTKRGGRTSLAPP